MSYGALMSDEPFHADVEPDKETLAWLRKRAEDFYHGDVGACVSELLKDAREREEYLKAAGWEPKDAPEDLWGPLQARLKPQSFRREDRTWVNPLTAIEIPRVISEVEGCDCSGGGRYHTVGCAIRDLSEAEFDRRTQAASERIKAWTSAQRSAGPS